MSKPINICIIIGLFIFFIGCASPRKMPVTPKGDEIHSLAMNFYKKAIALEHQGELIDAKEYFQLAIRLIL